MGAELSKEVKVAILEKNLDACRQHVYDLSINLEVSAIAGDETALESQKKILAVWMKKRDAFEKKLEELNAPAS
jgi:hypothetical protein